MNRKAAFLVLLLTFCCSLSFAQTNPADQFGSLTYGTSEGSRQLSGRSFIASVYHLLKDDAIYYDRPSGRVIVCKGQAAEACHIFSLVDSADVIAIPNGSNSFDDLLVLMKNSSLQRCTINLQEKLACEKQSIDQLSKLAHVTAAPNKTLVNSQSKHDNFSCTLQPPHFPTCSSARSLQTVGDSELLFGSFTGSRFEIIQIRGGVPTLCTLSAAGSQCALVQGLGSVLTNQSLLGTAYSTLAHRSQLVALNHDVLSICAFLNSTAAPTFACVASRSHVGTSAIRAYIVTTHTRAGLAASETVMITSDLRGMKHQAAAKLDFASYRLINQNLQAALGNSEVPSSRKLFAKKSGTGTSGCGNPDDNGISKNSGSDSTPQPSGDCDPGDYGSSLGANFSPEQFSGAYYDADGNYLGEDDYWSDSDSNDDLWQYQNASFDKSNQAQVAACLQDCDLTKATGDNSCRSFKLVAYGGGAMATAVVSVLFLEFGPGAYAVAQGGIAATGTFAGIVDTWCGNNVGVNDDQCRAACLN